MNLSTFWSFDSNASDSFNQADATPIGNPMYFPGYIGTGNCIMLNGIDQFVIAPFIALNNRSFTIELFVLLNIFSNRTTINILSQCETRNQTSQCLNLGIVNTTLLFSFNGDNLVGNTVLVVDQW